MFQNEWTSVLPDKGGNRLHKKLSWCNYAVRLSALKLRLTTWGGFESNYVTKLIVQGEIGQSKFLCSDGDR